MKFGTFPACVVRECDITARESINVLVYAGDSKPSITEHPIREYRNKDRMDQLA